MLLFALAAMLNVPMNNAEYWHLSFLRNYPQAAVELVWSGLFELWSLKTVLLVGPDGSDAIQTQEALNHSPNTSDSKSHPLLRELCGRLSEVRAKSNLSTGDSLKTHRSVS